MCAQPSAPDEHIHVNKLDDVFVFIAKYDRVSTDSAGRKWRGIILGNSLYMCVCVHLWARAHNRVATQQ